jgi:exodeoxyribonuclease X
VGSISVATFAVTDTETTGLDHNTDAVVEIGSLLVDWHGDAVIPHMSLPYFETLVNPNSPLTPDNSAIHGLIDEDLIAAPYIDEASEKFARWMPDRAVPVAHHLVFDAGFLPILSGGLCSKRLAMHVAIDAPNWKNQTLRYYFKEVARAKHIRELGDAHRAISDVTVTAAILTRLIDLYLAAGHPDDVDALIAFAESPVLFRTMPIGQHRGKPFDQIPDRDLRWYLTQSFTEPDLRFTIETHFASRVPVNA